MKSIKSIYTAVSSCALALCAVVICGAAIYDVMVKGLPLSWPHALINNLPWGVAFLALYVASIVFSLMIARGFFARQAPASQWQADWRSAPLTQGKPE
ncbi:hypothetical protein [Pantoea sp. B65]|uniref:hypothetical protein n=1 Tax=Pantoea sp. B65 TaxID=2813359 RepID=UPI0039B3C712